MAALSSVQGAENYLMGWPSNQLDEIMWNGLGEYDPLDHMGQRMGRDLEANAFTVNGSPKDHSLSEMSPIYGAVQGLKMQNAGSDNQRSQPYPGLQAEYMGPGSWDSMNASDLASVLVTAFPCERTLSVPSSLRLEGSDDEYFIYNEDHYFLQPERILSSNVDVYMADPTCEDDDSPAVTTSNDLLDTDIRTSVDHYKLRLSQREVEERESSTNCGLETYGRRDHLDDTIQHYLGGKSGDNMVSLSFPPSSLFSFLDSKPSKTSSSYPEKDRMDEYKANGESVSSKPQFPSSIGGNQYLGFNDQCLETETTTMINASAQSYIQSGMRHRQMPEFLVREDQGSDGGKSWCSTEKIDDNDTAYETQSKHGLLLGFPCRDKHRIGQAQVNHGRQAATTNTRAERQTRKPLQELTHLPSKSAEQASISNMHQGMGEAQSSWIESAQCTQPFFRQAPCSVPTGATSHSMYSQIHHQPHSIYQQQQLRMQMEMPTQFNDKRHRTNSQETAPQQYRNLPSARHYRLQCQMKQGIGMDLNIQKDEDSLEATVLQQLESTIKDMTTTKRFIIRDSFYRLAKGAKERQIEADSNADGKYGSMISSSLRLSSSGVETETNPFDRWMQSDCTGQHGHEIWRLNNASALVRENELMRAKHDSLSSEVFSLLFKIRQNGYTPEHCSYPFGFSFFKYTLPWVQNYPTILHQKLPGESEKPDYTPFASGM